MKIGKRLIHGYYLLFLSCVLGAISQADDTIQSRFVGPVRLAVWQHWQPSWNVERDSTFPIRFELVRGTASNGSAFTRLIYSGSEASLRVRLAGRAFFRTGEYSDSERDIPPVEVAARYEGGKAIFELKDDRFLPAYPVVT